MDIARLGYEIDSSGALKAGANLDKMTSSATKAEAGAQRLAVVADSSAKSLQRVAVASNNVAVASGNSAYKIRMAAMQFSQVAQQGSATGNYIQALAIQLPDLALGFGTVGIAAGIAAGVLLPLVANMVLGEDSADAFKDSMDQLKASSESLHAPMEILTADAQELADKYGIAAERVKELSRLQLELAVSTAKNNMREQADIIDGVIEKYTDLGRNYADTGRAGVQYQKAVSTALQDLASDLGITTDQAQVLQDAFFQIEDATTFREQQDALVVIQQALADAGVSASAMPADLAGALSLMISLSNVSDELANSLTVAAAAAANMNYGISVGASYSGTGLLPPMELPDLPRAPRKSSRRGGKSAADTAADKQEREDLAAKKALYESTLTAAEAYNDEVARLGDLHDRNVIGDDLYARGMAKLRDEFSGVAGAAERAQNAAADMFTSILDGSKTAKEAVADLLSSLAGNILNSGANALFDGLMSGGTGAAGGGLVQAALSLFSSKGTAFDSGNVVPFAKGGVVTSPTTFGYSGGVGLMGEAGPEAIMPLKRGSDGKLGVGGGSQQAVDVRVIVSVDDDGKLAVIAHQAGSAAAGNVVAQNNKALAQRQRRD